MCVLVSVGGLLDHVVHDLHCDDSVLIRMSWKQCKLIIMLDGTKLHGNGARVIGNFPLTDSNYTH